MRRSSSATIRSCAAGRSRLAVMAPSAAWWPQRATRPAAFGVRSAMPSTTAMRQCADLIFVPPRFEVYRAVSRQIHAIFADYTALIEPLSLDEAYLDVTQESAGTADRVRHGAKRFALAFSGRRV